MRARTRIALGAVIAASAMTIGLMGPALADPPNGGPALTSKNDITGVGSDTTQEVMGSYSQGWNNSRQDGVAPDGPPYARSWDAVGGSPIDLDGTGTTCAPITRPNGSSAGISALNADTSAGTQSAANNQCIDYARSSRGPRPGGTLKFIGYGRDVVSWAYFPTTGGPIPANLSLSTAQLRDIYECDITNWNQVGGGNATILPVLPQVGSGTRDFWLTSIGGGTAVVPGSCVLNGTRSGTIVQENSGTSVRNILTTAEEPRALFPYSVANWVSQRDPGGIPTDDRSGSNLNRINNTDPLTLGNNQATGKLNPAGNYSRVVYNVVKPINNTIPGYLRAFLVDYVCANDVEGRAVLTAFGFASLGTGCGVVTTGS